MANNTQTDTLAREWNWFSNKVNFYETRARRASHIYNTSWTYWLTDPGKSKYLDADINKYHLLNQKLKETLPSESKLHSFFSEFDHIYRGDMSWQFVPDEFERDVQSRKV